MGKLLVVALGGAMGAVARYWLGGWILARLPTELPLGTFVINVTGSFIIGLVMTLIGERLTLHPNWRLLVAVGFVGAYTTFSTFEYETFKLIENGSYLSAALNVILSVVVGFVAVALGIVAARYLSPEAIGHLQKLLAHRQHSGD